MGGRAPASFRRCPLFSTPFAMTLQGSISDIELDERAPEDGLDTLSGVSFAATFGVGQDEEEEQPWYAPHVARLGSLVVTCKFCGKKSDDQVGPMHATFRCAEFRRISKC